MCFGSKRVGKQLIGAVPRHQLSVSSAKTWLGLYRVSGTSYKTILAPRFLLLSPSLSLSLRAFTVRSVILSYPYCCYDSVGLTEPFYNTEAIKDTKNITWCQSDCAHLFAVRGSHSGGRWRDSPAAVAKQSIALSYLLPNAKIIPPLQYLETVLDPTLCASPHLYPR